MSQESCSPPVWSAWERQLRPSCSSLASSCSAGGFLQSLSREPWPGHWGPLQVSCGPGHLGYGRIPLCLGPIWCWGARGPADPEFLPCAEPDSPSWDHTTPPRSAPCSLGRLSVCLSVPTTPHFLFLPGLSVLQVLRVSSLLFSQ